MYRTEFLPSNDIDILICQVNQETAKVDKIFIILRLELGVCTLELLHYSCGFMG